MISIFVQKNRTIYLNALRSGNYKKGCIQSDSKGIPIINSPADEDGYCACAIMNHLFDPNGKTSTFKARKALSITGKDCRFIQVELNDTSLNFNQIADIIESKIFKNDTFRC